MTLYLFWTGIDTENCFKLVQQDTTSQTAEEHYANEERRWSQEQGGRDRPA